MAPSLRPDLAALAGYHSPQVAADVRLNTNESPYPPPRGFVDELSVLVGRLEYNRYPDRGCDQLRDAIASYHGVDPDGVFPANGSNEVIQTLLLAFGGPTRRALVFTPSYTMHTHIAETTATPVSHITRGQGFRAGPDLVSRALADVAPDLVFFCHPNNPTGIPEDAAAVEAALADDDRLVVVDEAYAEFAGASWLDAAPSRPNLAVCRTFSKALSVPALRLGFVVADAGLVSLLEAAHLPYHLNAVSQVAGTLALEYKGEMQARVEAITAERTRIFDVLDRRDDVTVWPSQANFLLLRPEWDAETVWRRLVDESVLVRNFASRPETANCLRVTVGTPDENDRFLEALGKALDEAPT